MDDIRFEGRKYAGDKYRPAFEMIAWAVFNGKEIIYAELDATATKVTGEFKKRAFLAMKTKLLKESSKAK